MWVRVPPATSFGDKIIMEFMKLEEAVDIVMELATESVIGDEIIANDTLAADEKIRQETAIATVEDFFVNNLLELGE